MINKYNCGDLVICDNPYNDDGTMKIGTIVNFTIHNGITYTIRFEYRPPNQNFKSFLIYEGDIIGLAEIDC